MLKGPYWTGPYWKGPPAFERPDVERLGFSLGVCAAKRDKGKRWGVAADFIAKSAAMSDFGT